MVFGHCGTDKICSCVLQPISFALLSKICMKFLETRTLGRGNPDFYTEQTSFISTAYARSELSHLFHTCSLHLNSGHFIQLRRLITQSSHCASLINDPIKVLKNTM